MEFDPKEFDKLLSNLLRERGPEARQEGCPDDELLARYLTSALSRKEKADVEVHLAACAYCLDTLVAAHQSSSESNVATAPQWRLDRIKNLVPPGIQKETILELVLKVTRRGLELLSTSGHLVSPAMAPVRGEGQGSDTGTAGTVQVEKETGRFKIGIEVERLQGGLCQAVVSVTDEQGNPADGIRLSLLSGHREQASFLTRGGEVVFEGVSPGDYTVSVSDAGSLVGTISLRLTPDS